MEFMNCEPKIFIISGKAKSGKDIVSDMIFEYYKDKKVVKTSYSYYLKDYAKRILSWDGKEESKPRDFLQQFGIGIINKKIDSCMLIRRLCEDIQVFSYFYDVIIVTDARLIDEIEITRKRFSNVCVIRVNRLLYDNGLTTEQKNHVTEVELDSYTNYDYVISNDSILEHLHDQVIRVLKEEENEK